MAENWRVLIKINMEIRNGLIAEDQFQHLLSASQGREIMQTSLMKTGQGQEMIETGIMNTGQGQKMIETSIMNTDQG